MPQPYTIAVGNKLEIPMNYNVIEFKVFLTISWVPGSFTTLVAPV